MSTDGHWSYICTSMYIVQYSVYYVQIYTDIMIYHQNVLAMCSPGNLQLTKYKPAVIQLNEKLPNVI